MRFFKIIKKKQIILTVITLMLITAGYFNYMDKNNIEQKQIINKIIETAKLIDTEKYAEVGDAVLVSGEVQEKNEIKENEEKNNQNEIEQEIKEIEKTEKIEKNIKDDYYYKSRLERDKMYSQMLEIYQEILENQTISSEQKTIAQNELIKINKEKNSIMISENLILAKGFEDVIVFINDKKANIVVKAEKLEPNEIAQIQNIITRELEIEIENTNISVKNI